MKYVKKVMGKAKLKTPDPSLQADRLEEELR